MFNFEVHIVQNANDSNGNITLLKFFRPLNINEIKILWCKQQYFSIKKSHRSSTKSGIEP